MVRFKSLSSSILSYGLVLIVLVGLMVVARHNSLEVRELDEDDDALYGSALSITRSEAALTRAQFGLEAICRGEPNRLATQADVERIERSLGSGKALLKDRPVSGEHWNSAENTLRLWRTSFANPVLQAARSGRPPALDQARLRLGRRLYGELQSQLRVLAASEEAGVASVESRAEDSIWRADWTFGGVSIFALLLTFLLSIKAWTGERHQIQARAALREQVAEREAAEARQRQLAEGIREVLKAADELLLCRDRDELLRRAVELARARLGIERCAIFLYTEGNSALQGTFGTNLRGKTTDERGRYISAAAVAPCPETEWRTGVTDIAPRLWKYYEGEALAKTVEGDSMDYGKRTWLAATPIVTSQGTRGYIFNDNGISGDSCGFNNQELLASFASSLGKILEIHEQRDILRASEERSRTLFHSLPQKIFFKDVHSVFVSVNDKFCETFGVSEVDIIGKTDYSIQPPEIAAKYQADDKRLMASREPEVLEEVAILHGQETFIETIKSPVIADNGRVVGILGLITDITARKQAERALQLANEELELRVRERTSALEASNQTLQEEIHDREEAQQAAQAAMREAEQANQAKSEFLSRMSHELRTPLNAIIGFGQILASQDFEEKQKRRVHYMLEGGQHLLKLIDEVLDLTRIETGRLQLSIESISLRDVLSQALDLMQPVAQEHSVLLRPVSLDYNVNVRADSQRLKQVLINLISNAIKYNKPGGTVSYSFLAEPPTRDTGNPAPESPRIRLEIHDSGSGIAEEMMPRLFMPFDRLGAENTSIPGTGLGLSLCQRLIHAMDGEIGARSVPGSGTTFWIDLPLAVDPAESPGTVAPDLYVSEHPAHETATVLYIEDNLSNLAIIQDILSEFPGLEVMTAMQGGIGLDLARQHVPDLILLDLHLPDIMGWEVLQQLRSDARTHDIPVIVVSADAMPAQRERLMQLGANAYVTKPLDLTHLLSLVHQYLNSPSAVSQS